ncbi:hypothetical protein Xhom_02625 [Xenorhabdus hominickii]|uniref:Uncharacterized protein n=1 Tax=Xenorhabdus hominickii TaxID=351679 RepID=A0A2G0Q629_XENHO|nr:hypothetical protein Xhom_02625 [Xenorhabdus hominickii]
MRNPAPHGYYTHKNGETVQVTSLARALMKMMSNT